MPGEFTKSNGISKNLGLREYPGGGLRTYFMVCRQWYRASITGTFDTVRHEGKEMYGKARGILSDVGGGQVKGPRGLKKRVLCLLEAGQRARCKSLNIDKNVRHKTTQ